jgi:hypothetical protein
MQILLIEYIFFVEDFVVEDGCFPIISLAFHFSMHSSTVVPGLFKKNRDITLILHEDIYFHG